MRAQEQGGRFTTDYEVTSIQTGITEDLRLEVGMEVDWWVWDPTATVVDAIYDVGSATVGRRWKPAIRVPVIVVQVFQGQTIQDDRGFYNADVLRFTANTLDINKALPDLIPNPDFHLRDRVVYRGGVFRPTKLYLRGQVETTYTILTIDLIQVKSEELITDQQFVSYAASEI